MSHSKSRRIQFCSLASSFGVAALELKAFRRFDLDRFGSLEVRQRSESGESSIQSSPASTPPGSPIVSRAGPGGDKILRAQTFSAHGMPSSRGPLVDASNKLECDSPTLEGKYGFRNDGSPSVDIETSVKPIFDSRLTDDILSDGRTTAPISSDDSGDQDENRLVHAHEPTLSKISSLEKMQLLCCAEPVEACCTEPARDRFSTLTDLSTTTEDTVFLNRESYARDGSASTVDDGVRLSSQLLRNTDSTTISDWGEKDAEHGLSFSSEVYSAQEEDPFHEDRDSLGSTFFEFPKF